MFAQHIINMLFHVTEPHRKGVKLTCDEILATALPPGELEIHDWGEGNAENRAITVAYLKHSTISYRRSHLQPLLDQVFGTHDGHGSFACRLADPRLTRWRANGDCRPMGCMEVASG